MIETWFILIIFSITVSAIGEIAQKLSVSSEENLSADTVNFYVGLIQTFLSLGFLIITNQQFDPSLSSTHILNLVVSSVLAFFFFRSLYSSYKGNSVSISQVIFSLSAFVSTVFGIFFFGESASVSKFLGVALIITGVAIASLKRGEKFSRYNLLALVAAVIYGFLTSIDKSFAISINVHYYQVLTCFGFVLFSLVMSGKLIFAESKKLTKGVIRTILISAVSFTIFNKLTYLAYSQGGEVGRVDAINNTSLFLIILLEVFFLKDRSNLKKKLLTAVLAVTGVMILGFIE